MSYPTDPLTQLQLQVARRADELAARGSAHPPLYLLCWMQAEDEILRQHRIPAPEPESPPADPGPLADPKGSFSTAGMEAAAIS